MEFVYVLPQLQRYIVVVQENVEISIRNGRQLMQLNGREPLCVEIETIRSSNGPLVTGPHKLFAVMMTFTSYLVFVLLAQDGNCNVISELTTPGRDIDYDPV
jgi:hypothetical protein